MNDNTFAASMFPSCASRPVSRFVLVSEKEKKKKEKKKCRWKKKEWWRIRRRRL